MNPRPWTNFCSLREVSTTHNIKDRAQFGKRCRPTLLHFR